MSLLHLDVNHVKLLRQFHSCITLSLHRVLFLVMSYCPEAPDGMLDRVDTTMTVYIYLFLFIYSFRLIIEVYWSVVGRKWGDNCTDCAAFAGRFEQIFYLENTFTFFESSIELHIALKCVIIGLVVQCNIIIDTVWLVKVGVFLRLLYHCNFAIRFVSYLLRWIRFRYL